MPPRTGRETPHQIPTTGRNHISSDGLPPPEVLGAYEKNAPQSAKLILKMAKREQSSQIHLRWADWFAQFVSMLIGRGFLWFLVYEAAHLALDGKNAAAFVAGIAPIVSVIYSTFKGRATREAQ